jgi:hypothetical protein
MTNFTLIGAFTFKVDSARSYRRVYSVTLKRKAGQEPTVRIKNVHTGSILFENLLLSEILIEGQPMQNLEQLRRIVYNFSCDCDGEEPPIDDNGIFDDTFDDTFE